MQACIYVSDSKVLQYLWQAQPTHIDQVITVLAVQVQGDMQHAFHMFR